MSSETSPFFYKSAGADVGFDPLQPASLNDPLRLKIKNATNLLSFETVDWGQVAIKWQASLYPAHIRQRLSVVHEGIDTSRAIPGNPTLTLPGTDLELTKKDAIITYVARNLEPYRGFHVFMACLPELLDRHPHAHVVIVGADGVSYGPASATGASYKDILLNQFGPALDLKRVHFLGVVPYQILISIFQISAAHIYLTYPFVLSWSVMEAMSAGCVVIGSSTPPVKEIIQDGHNGLLVDFFDTKAICDQVTRVLNCPNRMQAVKENARRSIIDKYDFRSKMKPRFMKMIDALVRHEDPNYLLSLLEDGLAS